MIAQETRGEEEKRLAVQVPEDTVIVFDQYRPLLFSIAYRMLGSATDAEDVVQDAFLRWLQADAEEVRSPKAFLSTVVTRLSIDQLRSARAQRETYVGPWLPEPISTSQYAEIGDPAVLTESLSFAFLVMLENLGPLERAVFLLRTVFSYEYAEIAEIVGKSEANCRQILHRAQRHLENRRPRYEVSRDEQERLVSTFMTASLNGDMQGLLNLLTDDIVFVADGGGKARAGLKPVQGPDKVARGMLGGLRPLLADLVARVVEVNGHPAIVGYLAGRPYAVAIFELVGPKIRRIYTVLNPDKLGWL